MTLADLEKFVTGPAIFQSTSLMHSKPQVCLAQKRKPQDSMAAGISEHQYSHGPDLLQITLTKILAPSPKRTEPPLQKCMFLRSLMKQLQYGLPNHTPCKRINLDLGPNDTEMMSESAALHNLHLTSQNSIATQLVLEPCPNKYSELFIPALQSTLTPTSALSTNEAKGVESTDKTDVNFNSFCSYSNAFATQKQPAESCTLDAGDVGMGICSSSSTVINAPTEMIDNAMIPSFENMDFQSLVQCSIEQFSSKEVGVPAAAAFKPQHADELDSIMQVLVGM